MVGAVVFFLWLVLLGGVLIGGAGLLVDQLAPKSERRRRRRFPDAWFCKGVLMPVVLWALMNWGLSFQIQPFMPQIQIAQNRGGPWLPTYSRCLGYGIFVVAGYWAAVTLGWGVIRFGRRLPEESRGEFKSLCWTYGVGMFLPAVIVEIFGGWPTLGLAASVVLGPLAAALPGVLQMGKLPPMYARAVARIKFGKYAEAESEILQELEKCEDDFEGWMMLAELYANQFHDLPEAERTMLEICAQPNVTSSQLAVALHRLADWHLKLGADPKAARRALQRICDRLAGTHLAYMARLRLERLPATAEELREQQHQPIRLPALGDPLDEAPAPPEADPRQALQSAKACVQRLTQEANNIPVREHLARLLAESLHQPDQAIEQLTLLLGLPGQPPARQADWVAQIAAWHLRRRQDPAAARVWLQRLLREFPDSAQAFAARRWLQVIERQAASEAGGDPAAPSPNPTPEAGPSL